MNDGDTFVRQGLRFKVRIKPDDYAEAPWECEDGHGPVRTVYSYHSLPAKRAGERVLHSSRGMYWLYDWQAAMRTAIKDGWSVSEETRARVRRELKMTGNDTVRSAAAMAVYEDEQRLRRWLTDDWCYVGVIIVLLDADGEETDKLESVWGIESDADAYITEIAYDLADGIITPKLKTWRAALIERRETRDLQRLAATMAGVFA
jgi:hypothetical protein